MTPVQLLVVTGAFIVAGIAKGAIAMGLPPIALALMTFALPLEDALALMVVPTMATNIWQAIYGRGFVRLLRRFWAMPVASIASLMFVAAVFDQLGSPRRWPGSASSSSSNAALALTVWRPAVSRATERWANPLIGLASGAVAGVTGVSAVPFLPYMQSLDIDRHDLVQALGVMFLFIIGALTPALAIQGAFNLGNLLGPMLALVPTFAGVWLGQKARHAVSAETFRRIFAPLVRGAPCRSPRTRPRCGPSTQTRSRFASPCRRYCLPARPSRCSLRWTWRRHGKRRVVGLRGWLFTYSTFTSMLNFALPRVEPITIR